MGEEQPADAGPNDGHLWERVIELAVDGHLVCQC